MRVTSQHSQPMNMIEIFKALSDHNRLQLYELLLSSDRTNSELMDATGLSQNLLSHHLSVLADCGLIRVHQGIGDARRRYFSPNLETTCEVMGWWEQHCPLDVCSLGTALRRPRRVLFLCMRNAARSLIAEAVARHCAANALDAHSAGIQAATTATDLIEQVLAERGIQAGPLIVQNYQAVMHLPFDYVITVCDRAHENPLPDEFNHIQHIHWSLRDPLEGTADPAQQIANMRDLLRELEQRIGYFVRRLADQEIGRSQP